MPTLNGQN